MVNGGNFHQVPGQVDLVPFTPCVVHEGVPVLAREGEAVERALGLDRLDTPSFQVVARITPAELTVRVSRKRAERNRRPARLAPRPLARSGSRTETPPDRATSSTSHSAPRS